MYPSYGQENDARRGEHVSIHARFTLHVLTIIANSSFVSLRSSAWYHRSCRLFDERWQSQEASRDRRQGKGSAEQGWYRQLQNFHQLRHLFGCTEDGTVSIRPCGTSIGPDKLGTAREGHGGRTTIDFASKRICDARFGECRALG